MFITYIHDNIEHRNHETWKSLTTSLFSYETFYYLWVKRFFDIIRESQSFYVGFSISPRPPTRVAPATRPLWASESHPSSSDRKTQLTDFLQNFQNPPRALPVHDVIHIPKSKFSIWDFYFDICERHILPARALTPALSSLYLTNPCAEPKGSQPN